LRLLRTWSELRRKQPQTDRQRHEALLRPVVRVALEPAALMLRNREKPRSEAVGEARIRGGAGFDHGKRGLRQGGITSPTKR
jgi:hypothetical protein